jgi:hypothetical protein
VRYLVVAGTLVVDSGQIVEDAAPGRGLIRSIDSNSTGADGSRDALTAVIYVLRCRCAHRCSSMRGGSAVTLFGQVGACESIPVLVELLRPIEARPHA